MDNFTASEISYKNGYEKGYESGMKEAARKMLVAFEVQFAQTATCECGHRKMSDFYNYCPYCGEKYKGEVLNDSN